MKNNSTYAKTRGADDASFTKEVASKCWDSNCEEIEISQLRSLLGRLEIVATTVPWKKNTLMQAMCNWLRDLTYPPSRSRRIQWRLNLPYPTQATASVEQSPLTYLTQCQSPETRLIVAVADRFAYDARWRCYPLKLLPCKQVNPQQDMGNSSRIRS